MEKGSQNQRFSILDMISLLGLVGFIAVVVGVILSRNLSDPLVQRAKSRSETLAQQLAFGGMQGVVLSPTGISDSRGPASVKPGMETEGLISSDPWGKKFRYKFLLNSTGEAKALAVWSDGPNEKRETTHEELVRLLEYKAVPRPFSGDDIGHFIFLQN